MVESLLEILAKRRGQTFYRSIDVHSVTNAIDESISLISIWNIVNQVGKYEFFYGSVVNNFIERQLFPDQMNRNCLDLILDRYYWNHRESKMP